MQTQHFYLVLKIEEGAMIVAGAIVTMDTPFLSYNGTLTRIKTASKGF